MSKCCLGLQFDKIVMWLLNELTIISSTGDVVWPHIPYLDGATDGFVLCKVDHRHILCNSSVWEVQ